MTEKSLTERVNESMPKEEKGTLEEKLKSQSALEKAINKTIDLGFMGLAAKFYLTSSILITSGFFIADMIMKKKKKEKIGLKGMAKSLFNNAADAATNSVAQEEMYRYIDIMPNKTFIQKIVKTLTMNPVVSAGYQLYYQGQQYIRKEIGYTKAIKAVFSRDLRKAVIRDFYEKKLKGQYWGKVWTVFKRVFPIHFTSINYITKQTLPGLYLPARMGIAANNDVIFALASKPDKRKKTYTSMKDNYKRK